MPTSTPASLLERPTDVPGQAVARARADWVDVAKGMGIVLVVFGHAVDGLLKAGIAEAGGGWAASYFAVYTFHMPLFFLLAGLFVQARLAADAGGFVHTALVRIAWPYLLWSVIQLAVIGALGSVVNSPAELTPWRVLSLVWEPTSQFWFLQALLVLHLASLCIVPRAGVATLLVVMLVARGVDATVELPFLLALPARFGLFYALGVAAGPLLRQAAQTLPRPRAAALAAAAGLVWAIAALPVWLAGRSHWNIAALPAAFAGTLAMLALSTFVRGGAARFWLTLGQASMAIYVLHVLFVAGVRIVLHKGLGIDQPVVILLVACSVGIAAPLLLRALALRAGLARALGLG